MNEISRREFLRRSGRLITASALPGLISLTSQKAQANQGIKENENPILANIRMLEQARIYSSPEGDPRIKAIAELREKYSLNADEISPEILNYIPGSNINFENIPGIKEIRENPNLSERVLGIIKLLSVETKEEIGYKNNSSFVKRELDIIFKEWEELEMLRILIIENKVNSKSKYLEIYNKIGKPTLEELNKLIEEVGKKALDIHYKIYPQNQVTEIKSNPAWNQVDSCNLYATSLLSGLGLEHRLAHRVDSQNRPSKEGTELSANDTLIWLLNEGSKYGWKDVTELNYVEKMQLLNEGYLFYGASKTHNWVVFSTEINGTMQPVLTQATFNTLLGIFDFNELTTNIPLDYYGQTFEYSYKFNPVGNGISHLFAIHIDDEKNPKIKN